MTPVPSPSGPDQAITKLVERPHDGVCTRCLTPGRCWRWDQVVRCIDCWQHVLGPAEFERRILADLGRFGEIAADLGYPIGWPPEAGHG